MLAAEYLKLIQKGDALICRRHAPRRSLVLDVVGDQPESLKVLALQTDSP